MKNVRDGKKKIVDEKKLPVDMTTWALLLAAVAFVGSFFYDAGDHESVSIQLRPFDWMNTFSLCLWFLPFVLMFFYALIGGGQKKGKPLYVISCVLISLYSFWYIGATLVTYGIQKEIFTKPDYLPMWIHVWGLHLSVAIFFFITALIVGKNSKSTVPATIACFSLLLLQLYYVFIFSKAGAGYFYYNQYIQIITSFASVMATQFLCVVLLPGKTRNAMADTE